MTPQETRDIVDWLTMPTGEASREKATHKRYTRRELAEKLGISYGHLRNVLAGNRELSKPAQMLLKMLAE